MYLFITCKIKNTDLMFKIFVYCNCISVISFPYITYILLLDQPWSGTFHLSLVSIRRTVTERLQQREAADLILRS